MKIGKYPVKHSYKIPRIIPDVFSVGLAVFICSVEIMFMTVYDDTLKTYIGGEALEKLMQADSSLGWKHWLTLIFPAAVLAVFLITLDGIFTCRVLLLTHDIDALTPRTLLETIKRRTA